MIFLTTSVTKTLDHYNLGVGFFTMMTVDEELEAGLKEALGVDELDEKELTSFTVHTDQKTGIKYVTANGYESRGGFLTGLWCIARPVTNIWGFYMGKTILFKMNRSYFKRHFLGRMLHYFS